MTIFNIRTVVCTIVAVAEIIFLLAKSHGQEMPVVSMDRVPEHIRASVLVGGCSGTVIRKGEKYAGVVTAAHCFRGFIGGQTTVRFIDGSETTATLLAVDRTQDLAELGISASAVLGVAPVCEGIPDKARYEAVGWPGGTTPRHANYFLMSPDTPSVVKVNGEQYYGFYTKQGGPSYWKSYDKTAPFLGLPDRWAFKSDGGGIVPGTSGCGLFANGLLVGCCSNNNSHKIATCMYCAPPNQLLTFLEEAETTGKVAAWNMGPWKARAVNFANAPADPGLPSNQPIVFSRFSLPILVAEAEGNAPQTAPPPPDAGHGQQGEVSPDAKAPAPPTDGEVYSGHGRKPKDLNSIKKRTKAIDQNRHDQARTQAEQARLQAEIEALKSRPEVPPQLAPPPEPITEPEVAPEQPAPDHTVLIVMAILAVAAAGSTVAFVMALFPVLLAGRAISFFRGLAGR